MATKIVVAGATGNVGRRIAGALRERNAEVVALVRRSTDEAKRRALEAAGVKVVHAELTDERAVGEACKGAACVVSAVQGLREVIVDGQAALAHAAHRAGVRRFIPSDFSSDFTQLAVGQNRNFDLRRELHDRLTHLSISLTSIFNGAFAEILAYNPAVLDLANKQVGYWGEADWMMDFSTMEDVAAFTAEAALDDTTPRNLRIASFQVSPRELAKLASDVTKTAFKLVRHGGVEELGERAARDRLAHPEGERELFPPWQREQYTHSMFSTQLLILDNARYPNLQWTSATEFLQRLASRAPRGT